LLARSRPAPVLHFALVFVSALKPANCWAEQARPVAVAGGGVGINSKADAGQLQQCLSDLQEANVEFVELGSVTKDGCTVEGAVQLDAISSPFGKVSMSGKPTIACLFARQFTTWVRNVGAPLTLAYMGSNLATIETGPGFVGRTRDGRSGEKISEHAKGNAIDIAAFRLHDGLRLSVKDASVSISAEI
jgi:hypothetical protein